MGAGRAAGVSSIPGSFLLPKEARPCQAYSQRTFLPKHPWLALSVSLVSADHPFSCPSPTQAPVFIREACLRPPNRVDLFSHRDALVLSARRCVALFLLCHARWLKERSPIFLAPGTSFVEDTFPTDSEARGMASG